MSDLNKLKELVKLHTREFDLHKADPRSPSKLAAWDYASSLLNDEIDRDAVGLVTQILGELEAAQQRIAELESGKAFHNAVIYRARLEERVEKAEAELARREAAAAGLNVRERDENTSFHLLPGESEYDRLERMYEWMKSKRRDAAAGEPVYQVQLDDDQWFDASESVLVSQANHGVKTRVLFTAAQPSALPPTVMKPIDLSECRTLWYEHDELSSEVECIPVMDIKKAIRAAGYQVEGE